MYAFGEGGLAEDKTEAVRWFRKAADQGDALARSYLTAQALGVPNGGTTIEANTTK